MKRTLLLLLLSLSLTACNSNPTYAPDNIDTNQYNADAGSAIKINTNISSVKNTSLKSASLKSKNTPQTDDPYVDLGKPNFKGVDTSKSYEIYGELDELGRCTTCIACIGVDLMPTEERGAIGKIKPTGWHTVKYDIVDGKYLYNRCHLIGYQLTAENANEQNLITGTRYLNVEGMLPFENKVADYVRETENHVLYRVTPDFKGDELVARGVQIEAESVEDNGSGVSFNVYCPNIQPGIEIVYEDGSSYQIGLDTSKEYTEPEAQAYYVINKKTKKYHKEDCRYAKGKNTKRVHKSKKQLKRSGYKACKVCKP